MDIEIKTYVALSAVMFLQYAIWGAWAPVLAARLLGPLKMTGKQTGWIYATLPIACIISPMIAGWLADQYLNAEWILIGAHVAGAVLLFAAARQDSFKPLLATMFLFSMCYGATLPLVNAVLFNATSNEETLGRVFIWAPLAWALVGWILTGWRMTRTVQGDGRDCLYFASLLSVLMAISCFLLVWIAPAPPAKTGQIPVVEALGMLGQVNFLIFILISLVVAGLMQFYFLGSAQFLQDNGVSSKHVPASMALAQIAQALATWFLLAVLVQGLGYKWTLTIGAACWSILYAVYIAGRPKGMLVGIQPFHGFAYVFFIIAGQMYANTLARPDIRSSMQALIFAATTGVGLFLGTQFAGIVMDKFAINGKFQWSKVWTVPFVIMTAGVLALMFLLQENPPQPKQKPPAAAVAPPAATAPSDIG